VLTVAATIVADHNCLLRTTAAKNLRTNEKIGHLMVRNFLAAGLTALPQPTWILR